MGRARGGHQTTSKRARRKSTPAGTQAGSERSELGTPGPVSPSAAVAEPAVARPSFADRFGAAFRPASMKQKPVSNPPTATLSATTPHSGLSAGSPPGTTQAPTPAGLDARRLLSVKKPLLSGRDLKLPKRPDERPPVREAWSGELTDEDYLRLEPGLDKRNPSSAAGVAGLNFICSSDPLWVPTSPQQKQYHAHIAIEPQRGLFCAVSTYGGSGKPHGGAKVWLRSSSLRACLNAVNEHLRDKQNGKYEPMTGASGRLVRLSPVDFADAFHAAAGR